MSSNIHGIGSRPKLTADDEKKMEMFSQRGSGSGTGVLRPVRRNDDNLTKDIITNAQAAQGSRTSADANAGQITIYANGFKVGDGPFRPKSDPQNIKFLEDLKKGICPHEIEREIMKQNQNAKNVGVNIVNRSMQTFTPPKPKFQAFTGEGQKLGSSQSKSLINFDKCEPQEYKLDEGQPKILIQVVLANRKRHRVSLNKEAHVLDLYRHVMFLSGSKAPFHLMAGFPVKRLDDPYDTVSGLAGSRVTQKMI